MIHPTVQAIVIADKIYRDAISKKFVICGTFNAIYRGIISHRKTPDGRTLVPGGAVSGSPSLYLCFTDIKGQRDIEVRFVRLSDSDVVFQTKFSLNASSPFGIAEFALPLPDISTFPFGIYCFEVVCESETIVSKRIEVIEFKEHKENTND